MTGTSRKLTCVVLGCALVVGVVGCQPPDEPPAKVATAIFAQMGEPVPWASPEQLAAFQRGKKISQRKFTPQTGLGPQFNTTSCTSCHEQPVTGGSSPRYRNFYLTGARLSDKSLVMLGKSGVQDRYSTAPPYRVATDAQATFVSTRNTIPFFGVGALAEIPEKAILAHADPDDADGDGISGRPNYDRGYVGRFGRKAQTVSIEGFIRGPLFNHVGVTSDPLPNRRKAELPVPSAADIAGGRALSVEFGLPFCPTCQAAAPAEPLVDDDGVADPELSEDDLFDLVSFAMLLAAPQPDELTDQGEQGRALFSDIGCQKCHVPGLKGPRGKVMAYTDLLLHDMGGDLADGIEQGVATGSEFRTQPLWGVAATAPYLHDGRAETIDQAIRLHGGEASQVRDNYVALSDDERAAVLEFLNSLGGRELRSDGLLPPGDPVPAVGSYGAPDKALAGAQAELYARGRRIFDRDVAIAKGLGPGFNGDSCRACHFEPTIGGAGPAGVDVTRQGIIDEQTGSFFTPAGGTMLHRLMTDVHKRPAQDPDANVFELRQAPPLYGLGLVDRIADAQIEAHADPGDEDGDGISGRVRRLPDGRIGRFGWKGDFPTLEDFVRDALSNEVGVTVPEGDGFVAGRSSDDDDAPDPEIDPADYAALVYYTARLGPPPAKAHLDDTEARGEQLFGDVGCTGCHTPELKTDDGQPVPLYSDLLLHDVAPPNYRGIESGDATMREFRTPPLWGIGDTGPYMHDGLAGTLDEAIRRHQGESEGVTGRYEALSEQDQAALIAFLEAI